MDSTLCSRKPSLYQEYGTKRAYFCQSPHRYSNCAACRIRNDQSPSPTRIRRIYRSGSGRGRAENYERAHSLDRGQVSSEWQQRDIANMNGYNMQPQPPKNVEGNLLQPPSPEILRREQERPSPPISPAVIGHIAEKIDKSPPRTTLVRSPLFNRPTFSERFSHLPADVVVDYNRPDASRFAAFGALSQQDQAQQTDYDSEYGKHWMTPAYHASSHWKDCCCLRDPHYMYHCSCPYCPSYWRNRLAPPPGFAHRKMFNYGLASLYDDLYHHTSQL